MACHGPSADGEEEALRLRILDFVASRVLRRPVKLGWKRIGWTSLGPVFADLHVKFGPTDLGRLRVDAVRLEAERLHLLPGRPARVAVSGARARISIDQSRVDAFTRRQKLPVRIRLTRRGLRVRTDLGPLPVSEFRGRLEIADGWFVLRPDRAAILGVPTRGLPFALYLPLPSVSEAVRLRDLEHARAQLHLHCELDDFEEALRRGLAGRVRSRFVARRRRLPALSGAAPDPPPR